MLIDLLNFSDALGLTSDYVCWWIFLLEEYSLEIIHIKGLHNTVACHLYRLDADPIQDDKTNWKTFTKCWCFYTIHATSAEITYDHQEQINVVFTNHNEEDVSCPMEIAKPRYKMQLRGSFKNMTSIPLYWLRILRCYARMTG